MAVDRFFGDDMTLSVETDDAVSIPIGSLQNVELIATAEHIELDSADTTLREDVRKRNFGVDVTIGFAAFDIVMAQEWLSGDGTTTDGTYADSTEVRLFNITGAVSPADGGDDLDVVVDDVYFPNMPLMSESKGEWTVRNLTGRGRTVTEFDMTP